jgi:two-component system, NarL family, sensor histidine kinase UhpB
MQTLTRLPLYWKVCLINGALFVAGTLVLALTPATVSAQVLVSEAITLVLGLSAILIANALLLRSVLRPLDRLTAIMPDVDLLRPGQRLPAPAQGAVRNLIESFNGMLARA